MNLMTNPLADTAYARLREVTIEEIEMNYLLKQIVNQHDPERDVNVCEHAPRVTWAENTLANELLVLIKKVEKLEKRIKELEAGRENDE